METSDKERLKLNTHPEEIKGECLNIKIDDNNELSEKKDSVADRWNRWAAVIRN